MKLAVTRPPSVSQPAINPPARGSAMAGRGVAAFASAHAPNAMPAPMASTEVEGEVVQPVRAEIMEAGEPTAWPDDAAESAFLAEARDRGEVVKAPRAAEDAAEENADPKALPNLDELVNRIPPEVRDTLEDLFRAKFVRVQRVPKRALKS